MIKFTHPISYYPKEDYINSFKLLKLYKDELNKGNIQSFLSEFIVNNFKGRISKILYEGGIDIFPTQENYICSGCFEGTDIIEIEVPQHIEIIGSYAFAWSELKKISFPKGESKLEILGFEALAGTHIKDIELPQGILHLDGSVFSSCTELNRIVIPNSLQSIGSAVFSRCKSLKDLNYSGTKNEWSEIYKDKRWLEDSSIEEIICSDGILKIQTW